MKKIQTILALLAVLDIDAAKKSLPQIDKEMRGKTPAVPESPSGRSNGAISIGCPALTSWKRY